MDEKIIDRLFLENTRVLFDFIQELSERCTNLGDPIDSDWNYRGYIGLGSLKGRENIINGLRGKETSGIEKEKTVSKLINSCYDNNGVLLYQNSLSTFLQFYTLVFGDPGQQINEIAEMLNYFNILRYLTEDEYREHRHKNFDAFPYIFEDLCLSIRNMTNAHSAYLVYKKEGEPSQLISRSGYVTEDGDAFPIDGEENKFSPLHIGASEFDLLIKALCKENLIVIRKFDNKIILTRKVELIDGIGYVVAERKKPDSPKDKREFLMFDFPFGDGIRMGDDKGNNENNIQERRHFYVILELREIVTKERLRQKAIRILFLRNRLHEAVKKYYAGVLNFRFYSNYIQSVAEQPEKGTESTNILHITDLHLNDDGSWSRNNFKKLLGNLLEHLSEIRDSKKINLIAVTGDIINYFTDAATAQRKYKRAANLLFKMAKILWGIKINNSLILPHDWKRRILITTGNHDYVTMGDVRVQTESRKIITALPAKATGGTMSKYTYYLEFLSYFIDAPTQKLLNSDLNEVREYDKLNLIIGIFNSCAQANALQTNKVSFNSEKLALVLKRGNWKKSIKTHVVLVHHYPSCPINYFNDKYEWWNFKTLSSKNAYKDFLLCYILYILSLGNYLTDEKRINEDECITKKELCEIQEFASLCEDISDDCNEIINAFKVCFAKFKHLVEATPENKLLNSELFRDMLILYDCLQEKDKRYSKEYVYEFLSDMSSLFKTMAIDKVNFKNDWDKRIMGKIRITIVGGHTHKAYKDFSKDKQYDLIIGHKFYDNINSGQIVFEILTVSGDKLQRDIHLFAKDKWYQEYKGEEEESRIKEILELNEP